MNHLKLWGCGMNKRILGLICIIILCATIVFVYYHNEISNRNGDIKQASKGELFLAYKMQGAVKKWGYINIEGKFIIPPKYDKAKVFMSNGLADVGLNYKEGLINKSGNLIVPFVYDQIQDYHDGIAVAHNSNIYYGINEKGKVVFKILSSSVSDFSCGLAVFDKSLEMNDASVYGYIDEKGKIVIKPQFKTAGNFNNGKAIVKLNNGKCALIDSSGRFLNKYNYDWLYDLDNNTIVFLNQNKYGLMSTSGKILINAKYDKYLDFGDGFAAVEFDSKYGLIDKNGDFIIPPEYSDISDVGGGFFSATKYINGAYYSDCMKKALFNKNGKRLTNFKYYTLSLVDNNYIAATDDKSTYLIYRNGEISKLLPAFEGSGTIIRTGNAYKLIIDDDLAYYTIDGKQIWKADNTLDLGNGIRVKQKKYRPDFFNKCLYPEITGLPSANIQNMVNNKLKKSFINNVIDVKSEDQDDDSSNSSALYDTPNNDTNSYNCLFSVDKNKDLIMITSVGHDFQICNGKEQVFEDKYYINVKNGRFYSIQDLFKKDSNYYKVLSDIVINMIRKNNNKTVDNPYNYNAEINADSYANNGLDIDTSNLQIKKNVLCITFTPFELGLTLDNPDPEYDIPYKDVINIINTHGEFWKSFDKVLSYR